MDYREVPIQRDAALTPQVGHAVTRLVQHGEDRSPEGWAESAVVLGGVLPRPGEGRTAEAWSAIATLGAVDLQLARALEPHLDALAILAQAEQAGHESVGSVDAWWGVFAAEGAGTRLSASPDGSGWRLDGEKPWCSLADRLSHALVTAWVDDEQRGLFAVELADPGIEPAVPPGQWAARGLRDIVSLPLRMQHARARAVGPPEWYLRRDGFAWGGVGVAAIWYGGAVGLARRIAAPRDRPRDQVSYLLLGEVDQRLAAARAVLADAAAAIDGGRASGDAGALLALRARSVVALSCEAVLSAVDHELGPGPLATEPEHAGRVADLRMYLRQHHAERDLAALGRMIDERNES